MRDFSVAIGLVLAIEGLLMAGFANSMRARMAVAAREDPGKLRGSVLALLFLAWGSSWGSRSLL